MLETILGVVGKLAGLGLDAWKAKQAGDDAAHAQAVKAMEDAFLEGATAARQWAKDHATAMEEAGRTLQRRFPGT